MKKTTLFFFFTLLLISGNANADLKISAQSLREYQLPGTFNLAEAAITVGANNDTIITSTLGASPESSACGIVQANENGAKIIEYKFNAAPTRCLGVIPHPKGGVFLRGDNPISADGVVSGFTAFLDGDGREVWAIPDQRLVDATAKPNGTGIFLGEYEQPLPIMAYSEKLDKLIAFTVGRLNLGMDQKFISQAHVINVESGQFRISGQTFGQSGVGIVGGVAVRNSDGHFILYYYSSGVRGAFFYAYDGRRSIDFFKPRGEEWDTRFIKKMVYQNDLLNLLWTDSEEPESQTRLSVVTDTSAELWTALFDSQYTFSTGIEVNLGAPLSMWIGKQEYIILHQSGDAFFLRHVDKNGASFGVGTLDELIPVPPVAVAITNEGDFKLFGYNQDTRFLSEFSLQFEDKPDYDPEVGPRLPDDVGIPADVGLSDVLEAAGCCATVSIRPDSRPLLPLFLGLLIIIRLRQKRD